MSLSLITIRLMIGISHLFVFSNPIELEKLKTSGKEIIQVTYELAQEEIAQNSGYNLKQRSSSSISIGKVTYFSHLTVRCSKIVSSKLFLCAKPIKWSNTLKQFVGKSKGIV